MATTLLTLRDILGKDILSRIFEFDPTYKNMLTSDIIPFIWSAAWQKWHATSQECNCPFVYTVMEWLFQSSWGIYKLGDPGYNPDYDIMPPSKSLKKIYYPSDVRVVNRVLIPETAHYVSIYLADFRVIYGLVVTQEYYENEYSMISNDRESQLHNMIEAFVDQRAGMVVLIYIN